LSADLAAYLDVKTGVVNAFAAGTARVRAATALKSFIFSLFLVDVYYSISDMFFVE